MLLPLLQTLEVFVHCSVLELLVLAPPDLSNDEKQGGKGKYMPPVGHQEINTANAIMPRTQARAPKNNAMMADAMIAGHG